MPHPTPPTPLFATTHWSVVLQAQSKSSLDSREALETLCRTYWYPLYAYIRRAGRSPHDAQDLTQEFFSRLLEKDWLLAAAPEHGRFRTFLLMALKRFMAREWHRSTALKRGGTQGPVSLDALDAEQRYAIEPVDALAPDEIYERRWAMMMLDQALEQLGIEFAAAGKDRKFQCLKHWLGADRGDIPYSELAVALATTEGAARVALHRLRKRFRQIFRDSIASTVAEGEDVDAEVQYLVSVLSRA
ncbi:MAG TPA: sigma-70 family RNA polymerase sigma factor [Prosthecobacter sp.]|nr:sigma-70 family RNA polymerase sigma factor [Prosthecobacter sp.]